MAVARSRRVDGRAQLEHFDQAVGREVEVGADDLGEERVVDRPRSLRIDEHRDWLGHADRVGDLHFAHARELGRDDVLGDVARHVRRAAVDLRGILAAEGAAAVTTATAVGVDDDLATSQSAVAVRPADLELASRVHEDLHAVMPPLAQDRLDDRFSHGLLEFGLLLLAVPLRAMLRREHNRVDLGCVEAVVFDGDLALRVRTDAGDDPLAADLSLALDEAVRQVDRQRHETVGLLAGEAEHHALIAGALRLLRLAHHAARDVGRLLVQQVDHAAAVAIEAHRRVVVTDPQDRVAHGLLDVELLLGVVVELDLARNDRLRGGHQRLARATAFGIMVKDQVEHGVRNRIGNLVGVAHRNAFRGEQVALVAHGLIRGNKGEGAGGAGSFGWRAAGRPRPVRRVGL